MLNDGLLNDCLSDALIYQGDSREGNRQKMMAALDATFARQGPGPLILITGSLGSKITFGALNAMLERNEPATARSAASRLMQVFMVANQLPILGLADQVAGDQQTSVFCHGKMRFSVSCRCASRSCGRQRSGFPN